MSASAAAYEIGFMTYWRRPSTAVNTMNTTVVYQLCSLSAKSFTPIPAPVSIRANCTTRPVFSILDAHCAVLLLWAILRGPQMWGD